MHHDFEDDKFCVENVKFTLDFKIELLLNCNIL